MLLQTAQIPNSLLTCHPGHTGICIAVPVFAVSAAVGRTWEPLWGCRLPQMPGGSLPGTRQTPCQRLTCHGGHVTCRHQSERHLHECHFPPVSRAFVGQPLLQFTSHRGCQALSFIHATPMSTCRSPSAPAQSHAAGVKGLDITCKGVMARGPTEMAPHVLCGCHQTKQEMQGGDSAPKCPASGNADETRT